MVEGDIAPAVKLTDTMGWGFQDEDFKFMMKLEPQGCFIAEDDKRFVGLTTTISFESPMYGYLYLMGKEILPLKRTVIIGKALITTTAYDETSGIEKVEFYIDDELKQTITNEPYEWLWDETIIGTHTIKAIAYDNSGNMVTDEQVVWIFNL